MADRYRNKREDIFTGLPCGDGDGIEDVIDKLEPLYMEYGSQVFLTAVGRLLREPAESAATLQTVGEIIERLAQWEI